ncbi:ribonuclease domain-containing protein [Catenulispora rubra]|uniref:ribonuclease domain-containing protein n=1 Tax=Catenulispora rubra TaxID=280293 RepID=UPI0018922799|nr:ribonuclease domain-containing protein [Catenulispora rubra]
MTPQRRLGLSWTKRLAVALAATASTLTVTVIASPAANATVYNSCTSSGCADAASANSIWSSMNYPSSRGWYDWPDGECNYAGGTYYNDDGQLPSGDSFQEFDVYPRRCGAHRDAVRIVVDMNTGQVWYSPDHYADFYVLS